jgi:uncharacterized protein YecE (DUF72 family)
VGTIRIGCSGWQYRDWRGVLYPQGLPQRRWLARYAEVFDTVEVNSTFYRLAGPGRSRSGWPTRRRVRLHRQGQPLHDAHQAPAGPRGARAALLRGDRAAGRLAEAHLRPVAAAATFRRDVPRLASALDVTVVAAARPARVGVPRPGVVRAEVLELLRWHRAGSSSATTRSGPWQPLEVTAPPAFVRFHFGAQGRRGNYSRAELEAWVPRLRALAADADVLVYFNNDWEGFAVRNARLLRRLLAADGANAASASAASAGTAQAT